MILELGKHTSEDLQPQLLLVPQPVGATLEDSNLIVQPFHEAKGNLVVGVTIRGDAVPMPFHQLSKLFVGFAAVPLQGGPPILKEAPRPAFRLIAPPLAERLLGGVLTLDKQLN